MLVNAGSPRAWLLLHMTFALRLLSIIALLLVAPGVAQAPPETRETGAPTGTIVEIYLFWTATCPHCTSARGFLERLVPGIPGARLRSFELDGDGSKEVAFIALSKQFKNDPPAVPFIVVGDEAFVGYRDDTSTGAEIEHRIRACLSMPCADVAGPILAQAGAIERQSQGGPGTLRPRIKRSELPATISIPGIGSIKTSSLSLPMLTIVLGAIDGFNPCAMWVLVFLIGSLVGLNDRLRMWSYGAALRQP